MLTVSQSLWMSREEGTFPCLSVLPPAHLAPGAQRPALCIRALALPQHQGPLHMSRKS